MSFDTELFVRRAAGVPGAVVATTIGAVAALVARVHRLGGITAERNAWDAVCVDRARRRELQEFEQRWGVAEAPRPTGSNRPGSMRSANRAYQQS